MLVLCVVACSDNEKSSAQSEESIIEPQMKALEKAKGVEQQLLDAAEQQRKHIEAH